MQELFSFDASIPLHLFEYRLPEESGEQHWHSFYEIGYCMAGSGVFYLGDRSVRISQGDILLFPPYEAHIAKSEQGSECRCFFAYFNDTIFPEEDRALLLAFRQTWVKNEQALREDSPSFPLLTPLFNTLLQEYVAKETGYEAMLRARMLELCVRLHRIEERQHSVESWSGLLRGLAQMRPVLEYIARSYAEPIELADIARLLSLSPSRARHLFKESVGKRFKEYVTFVRIQEAKRLLAMGDETVTDVYLACGFQSAAPFYRSFQQLVGLSPLAYRERAQKQG